MKKICVFFAFIFTASLFSGCGSPKTINVELPTLYSGPYYSISYPGDFNIRTNDLDLEIFRNDISIIVKKQTAEKSQRGNLASLSALRYELEQKAKREGAELLVTDTKIGAESALGFEYESTTKYGLLYAIPMEGNIVLVGSDNPQELGEGEVAANRVEQIKTIVKSFRITKPTFFEQVGNNNTGTTDNGSSSIKTKPFENEFFKFNIPENWVAFGEDMVTIQPSASQSVSSGQEISFTNIANAGKDYNGYATDLFKVFKGTSIGDQTFGENTFKYYTFMLESQERIHLFIGKNTRVVMINASSVAGKLLIEHEGILKSFEMK
jgi:hypothetical protein